MTARVGCANAGSGSVIDGLIHISWAGPERWLQCAGKLWCFEDHHYCGPVVLTNKTREPAENQPPERSPFWTHVNAWYRQGKRVEVIRGKAWCIYETEAQQSRRLGDAERREWAS